MIPNCKGCEEEIFQCYQAQEEGLNSGLEGMGEKKHCSFFIIDPKTNKFIVEYCEVVK